MDLQEYLTSQHIDFTVNADGAICFGGSLDLIGTGITSLPNKFTAASVYLDPEHFSNVAYRTNSGRQNRIIFAAWANDAPHIAAGCFWGPLHEFESAVDENYYGGAAEAYKQNARDCVSELAEKLNKLQSA